MRTRMLLLAAVIAACGDDGHGEGVYEVAGRDPYRLFEDAYARPVAPATLAAWTARAEPLRADLRARAGLAEPRPAPSATVVGTRTFGNVRIEDLRIEGFDGLKIPAALYLPLGAAGPVPGVVIHVGHDAQGQNAPYIRTLAWRFARSGVAALTTDWWGMGSRFGAEWRHVPIGLRSILAGLPPTTPVLEEPLRAWEYLASRPEVDAARVGMAGQSGGGMVTMHLAALDPRIAAAVVVDIVVTNEYMFEDLRGWGDPDSVLPGFLARSAHGELLALVAPRPLFVLSGDEDAIGPTTVAAKAVAFTRDVYDLFGAGPAVEHQGLPTRHCWCDSKIDATLAFLGQALTGAPITSAELPPPGSGPAATPPAGDPTWLELVDARWMVSPPAPADAAEAAELLGERRLALDAALGFARRPAAALGVQPGPVANGKAIVWVADGRRERALEEALAAQAGWLLLLDPAGMGDALAMDATKQRYLAQFAIGLDTPLLGLGAADVVWAAEGLRLDGAYRVVAVCDGPQAALACLAAAALGGEVLDGFVLRGLPATFQGAFPLGEPDPALYYVSPYLGSCANPDVLLAMAAPRPLAVVGAGAAERDAWTYAPAAYGVLDAAGALRLDASDLASATEWVLGQLR